jgi:hypothetical protein
LRGVDCDTDHNLVVAKVRERLALNKQVAQKFDVARLNLRKLSELEVRKQYQIKISNRFAALENLNDFQAGCMVHLVCVVQYSSFPWVSLRTHVVSIYTHTHTQIQNHENTDNYKYFNFYLGVLVFWVVLSSSIIDFQHFERR